MPGEDLKGADEFEAFRRSDKADVATAYFAHSARLMSRIAEVIGRDDDAIRYGELADRVRAAWQAEFIDSDGRLHPDTQANHVRALAFDLVPPELRPDAAARLVELIRAADTHLATGFLATPYLLPVLADAGHADVAYELLFSDTMPSWLYMIDRGATTVWERWNGMDSDGVPFESLNHYSKGAVISFLHRYVAGIRLLDGAPAYRHFRVQPLPGGGITWAQAEHDSPLRPDRVLVADRRRRSRAHGDRATRNHRGDRPARRDHGDGDIRSPRDPRASARRGSISRRCRRVGPDLSSRGTRRPPVAAPGRWRRPGRRRNSRR